MSDRPAPETDAASFTETNAANALVLASFSRKLERERDELRDKYDNLATEHMLVINKLCKERDEARVEIQRLRLDAQKEAEHHDRMVKELEGLYDQLAKTKPSNEHICSLSKDLMGNCIICDG